MNILLTYLFIGMFLAAVFEVNAHLSWGGLYKPNIPSFLISTMLWPYFLVVNIRNLF